jgi:polyketide synthase 12
VLPVIWAGVPAGLIKTPFFDEVRPARTPAAPSVEVATPGPAPTPASPDWAALPARTRISRLRDFIRTEAAAVLGLASAARLDPAKGFFALGMDSLTAVELRNRLQSALARPLPSTVVFDHPSCDALADHLTALFIAPEERSVTDLLEDELKDL